MHTNRNARVNTQLPENGRHQFRCAIHHLRLARKISGRGHVPRHSQDAKTVQASRICIQNAERIQGAQPRRRGTILDAESGVTYGATEGHLTVSQWKLSRHEDLVPAAD